MKKSIKVSVIFILVLIVSTITGCNSGTSEDRDFNMVFKYGVHARNELDTFKNEFTKDMIEEPSITVKMTLTEEELASIYNKMKEIDFFSYPDEFIVPMLPGPDGLVHLSPSIRTYYFKVEYEGIIKELSWEDKVWNKNEDADKLRGLTRFIEDIIESKEEYKELPKPASAYI